MEPPLLKAILERVVLFFVPIALGYLWRWATERRAGPRPEPLALTAEPAPRGMRKQTLLWLAAAGAVLVAASLIGGVLLPHAPDRSVYVPAEVQPGGGVSPGHFESSRKP
jgi:hypothetical protein